MSKINKWFSSVMSSDFSYRQAQNRPVFFSGPSRHSVGTVQSVSSSAQGKKKRFVAGKSLAGSDEVAG